jgi:hypothetical protein
LEAARRGLRALTRFARFCDRIRVYALAEAKRGVLERYLADLQTGMTSAQRIGMHIGQLNNFPARSAQARLGRHPAGDRAAVPR